MIVCLIIFRIFFKVWIDVNKFVGFISDEDVENEDQESDGYFFMSFFNVELVNDLVVLFIDFKF